ncbi:copper chaperone PCu(A)C [Herpetosiphon giganteus]|uniref:copper chaperone PCu(A)C n=1 Tax=Herpetosiphon giganteus TaxID=2029754 RepID=UPI00195E41E7|nr:copper chaperone PCu(A)C [Herpetosiphon giganteus]MBM7843233.1 copper(I)-binding protein [Herpetosiphon giganteus]
MKRLIFAVLLLVLAACGSETTPTTVPNTSNSAANTLGSLTIEGSFARPAFAAATLMQTPTMETTPISPTVGGGMGGGAMMGSNSAAYMTIRNTGAADTLIAASTDVAGKVELHTVTADGEVMKMEQVEKIEVPANGEAVLKPGGFHIMLLEIKQDLKVGDTLDLTLTFEKAGKITVKVPVQMPSAQ